MQVELLRAALATYPQDRDAGQPASAGFLRYGINGEPAVAPALLAGGDVLGGSDP